jgi:hypothetical protein
MEAVWLRLRAAEDLLAWGDELATSEDTVRHKLLGRQWQAARRELRKTAYEERRERSWGGCP